MRIRNRVIGLSQRRRHSEMKKEGGKEDGKGIEIS